MSVDNRVQLSNPVAAEKVQFVSVERTSKGLPRDAAMDYTKGALVLFMVLYHWLNYFIESPGHAYDYLRFLTPSFIFITGFMISRIHLTGYKNSGRNLSKRLAVRGFKLLGLVFVLNALLYFAAARFEFSASVVAAFVRNMCWALIVANPAAAQGQKGAAFTMLVPIAYLLALSALIIVFKAKRTAFCAALLILVVSVILSYSYGMANSYLDLLMIGALGVVIGFTDKVRTASLLNHPTVLIVLYCCYLTVISVWHVTLPLVVASVVLTTALLYIAGSRKAPRVGWERTVFLGKYSLLGYIVQIAILQGLRRMPWFSQRGVGALVVSLLLGVLLTFALVDATDFARRKSALADRLYRFALA